MLMLHLLFMGGVVASIGSLAAALVLSRIDKSNKDKANVKVKINRQPI